jgi:proteasome alpha subunit
MSRGRQYDQAITIFSPEGRIYQVEYALELVKRGAPIVGIQTSESSILTAIEIEPNSLVVAETSKKIFRLDEHVGTGISGLSPDARVLIRQARLICQSNRLTYDEPIDIETLTGELGDLYQTYTQNAGVRPFGVSMIMSGIDTTGTKIISIDPSGSYRIYKATAIGRNNEQAKERLEELYRDNLNTDEGIAVAIDALRSTTSEPLEKGQITIGIVPKETKRFKELSDEDIAKYL